MLLLRENVILVRVGTGRAEAEQRCGVMLRLDAPVAAFVGPTAWRWLAGDEAAGPALPARSRAECLAAWTQAGLIGAAESVGPRGGEIGELVVETNRIGDGLTNPVLAIGLSADCGFCAQLEADLAANANVLRGAGFGVLLVGEAGGTRSLGLVPPRTEGGLARLAARVAESATPAGVLVAPGRAPIQVSGYDEVTAALVRMSGWGRDVVVESPTSCSVSVLGADGSKAHPIAAGDKVIGLVLRGHATCDLAAYVASRSAGAGYAPPVLIVERLRNLFLVFRGGEMIARLRSVCDLEGLLDTILASYAGPVPAGVPVLCGALVSDADDGASEAILFPRSWMSDLVRQQSRLRLAGWTVCPDLHIQLASARPADPVEVGLCARVHPSPTGTPGPWPTRTALVREILLDPGTSAGFRVASAAQLLAQAVNWVVRPATADQVHALAAALAGASVRTSTCPQLISELTGVTRR